MKLLMLASMAAIAAQDPIFDGRPRRLPESQPKPLPELSPEDRSKLHKKLREFTVEGKKVMAYSKRDALKRYGTKKGKKRK